MRESTCASITYLSNAYRHSKIGDVLELWFNDQEMEADTRAWAKKTKNEILEAREDQEKIVAKPR